MCSNRQFVSELKESPEKQKRLTPFSGCYGIRETGFGFTYRSRYRAQNLSATSSSLSGSLALTSLMNADGMCL